MDETAIIRIAVERKAKDDVQALAEKLGMTELAIASRVYSWFIAQDDVIRKGILGLLPDGYEQDIGQLLASRLASGGTMPAFDKLVGVTKRGGKGGAKN